MKVIYEKSIKDKLLDEIGRARKCGRAIKEIQLTRKERQEFSSEATREALVVNEIEGPCWGRINGFKIVCNHWLLEVEYESHI